MKAIGITRRVDELGRIVLPIELRKTLGINERDSLEIFVDGEKIVLQKYEQGDIFTGETNDLVEFNGKKVSKDSILKLAKLAELQVVES